MTPEGKIQNKLITILKKEGGYPIKLMKTNINGIPDVINITKDNVVEFYEVKVPGKEPTPLQKHRIKELNERGIKAIVYDGTSLHR